MLVSGPFQTQRKFTLLDTQSKICCYSFSLKQTSRRTLSANFYNTFSICLHAELISHLIAVYSCSHPTFHFTDFLLPVLERERQKEVICTYIIPMRI
jgi:hypothetical protein